MSDEMNTDLELEAYAFEQLKDRANLLGVKFHPSISAEKLSEKVAAHLASLEPAAPPEQPSVEPPVESQAEMRQRLINEQTRLVRVRVTCMNPAKREWDGEVFTTGNSLVGTIKKYVPFNNDAGWHVPQIILNMMAERECQIFVTKSSVKGVPINETKMIKEFAIDILPPLTMEEMKDLAQQQAMAGRIG